MEGGTHDSGGCDSTMSAARTEECNDGAVVPEKRCQPFTMIPLEPWNLEPRILSVWRAGNYWKCRGGSGCVNWSRHLLLETDPGSSCTMSWHGPRIYRGTSSPAHCQSFGNPYTSSPPIPTHNGGTYGYLNDISFNAGPISIIG